MQFKSLSFKKSLLVCVVGALGFIGSASAQTRITVNDPTQITQTKATLSADFPDTSVGHGFQYKPGTLPKIDEFSMLALAEGSDPVPLINNSSYRWVARTAKGWLESPASLPVGAYSILLANVTLNEDSEISFDWAVDSEENVGILTFSIDGLDNQSISGYVDFKKVTVTLPAGSHSLAWTYNKKSSSNVGLDIGMVKDIFIPNTTSGDWNVSTIQGSSAELTTLTPGTPYIFRAFASGNKGSSYSDMSEFQTLAFDSDFFTVDIDPITQTTAKIQPLFNICDNNLAPSVEVSTFRDGVYWSGGTVLSHFIKYAETNSFSGSNRGTVGYNNNDYGRYIYTDFEANISGHMVSFSIRINEPFRIKFNWGARGIEGRTAWCEFMIDGEKVGELYANSEESFTYSDFEYIIPEGEHRLVWDAYGNSGQEVRLANCEMERLTTWSHIYSGQEINTGIMLKDLIPGSKYQVKGTVSPTWQDAEWDGMDSEWIYFSTLNIGVEAPEAENVTQASISVKANINKGDATLSEQGLQYKVANGGTWVDSPKDLTNSTLRETVNRLRPATQYQFRAYARAEGCDTVFSEVKSITTLPIELRTPELVSIGTREAEIKGTIIFGDASIYQRGLQFRMKGHEDWEDLEDAGVDSVFYIKKTGLQMNKAYEARAYVQPAGSEMMYSDILEFSTHAPEIKINSVTNVNQRNLTLQGRLDPYGEQLKSVKLMVYSGIYPSTTLLKSIDMDVDEGEFSIKVVDLLPNTHYSFVAEGEMEDGSKFYSNNGHEDTEGAFTVVTRDFIDQERITAYDISLTTATLQAWAYVTDEPDVKYEFRYNTKDVFNLNPGEEDSNVVIIPVEKDEEGFIRAVITDLMPQSDYCVMPVVYTADAVFPSRMITFRTPKNQCKIEAEINFTSARFSVEIDQNEVKVENPQYKLYESKMEDYLPLGNGKIEFTDLEPNHFYMLGIKWFIGDKAYYYDYEFYTKNVTMSTVVTEVEQTSALVNLTVNHGELKLLKAGVVLDGDTTVYVTPETDFRITELSPSIRYSIRPFAEFENYGRIESGQVNFTTKNISCETLPVTKISNRSATMNGTIDCDGFSSAEFGFQWKQMQGWDTDPAFTKGVKSDDGSISVALINGMLEPNTDYQYRTAVRYKGEWYVAEEWTTFRTESEYVYYPATVYTVFRTDRENNRLILCGYYVAGSEIITAQGYEYWKNNESPVNLLANDVVNISTDESMQYELDLKTLLDGNYSVRAYVTSETGITTYGDILTFGVGDESGINDAGTDAIEVSNYGNTLIVRNATGLACRIYSIGGACEAEKMSMSEVESFEMRHHGVYVLTFSNGVAFKVIL